MELFKRLNKLKILPLSDTRKKEFISSLTDMEKEVYLLLVEGYKLKEAARRLKIKRSAAGAHMARVFSKLNVETISELIINYRDMEA